jgi:anti-sigma B factor antagonist
MAELDPAAQVPAVAQVRDEDGTPVIWLSGELDITTIAPARTAIDAALVSHPGRVLLDASGLEYMDSSGIALLVWAARRTQEVQVRNPSPVVKRLIEVTGLSEVLRITDENRP